jgi:GNAT superfamily N-acetyltransferase
VRVREWDPAIASAAELTAWLRAYNDALAADLPDDPAWGLDRLREYLTVTMPGERRLTWLAEDSGLLGYGRLLMQGGLGVLELYVVPGARRSGIGRTLLRTIANRALSEGFTSLVVEVIGGTAAAEFYASFGFSHAYTEMRSILPLSSVDWTHVQHMADGIVSGYRVDYHPNDLPDEILASYAEAKQVRRLDLPGDLDLRPSSYDAERLRTSLRCLRERGLEPYIVVAVHERTGRVAGLTELVVPAQHPSRADQYDTTIVREHDGYGLARAIKARMLLELRDAEPQLREVQTWHAVERAALQQVNKELGFRPDREWLEFEADAGDLAERLA